MKYKLIERVNPANPADPKKWYASPVNAGKFTIKNFAKEIAGRSSLTRGDIENVLNNFLDELPVFLKLGMSVQLGEFGTLRLGISSEGTDTKEQFSAAKIRNVKIIFTPSSALKTSLKDDLAFEQEQQ
ncbi:MAG: HU family DNA-binding protein [Bacteroidales bacterium]|jgi:predicted histone-like DNA-binding protein|nr:HU family DNA-binding protein [Bacteroidales bacterium]